MRNCELLHVSERFGDEEEGERSKTDLFVSQPLLNEVPPVIAGSVETWVLWVLRGFREHVLTASPEDDLDREMCVCMCP